MADTEKSYILGKKDNEEFTPIARLVFDADNMPVVTVLNGSEGAAALQSAIEEITSRDMLEVDGRREKTDDSGETVIQFIKSQVPKGTEAYSSALRQVLARDYGYTVIHER